MNVETMSLEIGRILREKNRKLVLAESCTGGNVCGALVRYCPGISSNLTGSFVVYQRESKQNWLGLSGEATANCESEKCCEALAVNLLTKFDSEDPNEVVALAVVGDLDPNYGNKYYICIHTQEFRLHFIGEFNVASMGRSERIDVIVEQCLTKLLYFLTGEKFQS